MAKCNEPMFELLQLGGHQMPGVWRYLFPEEFQWLKVPDERHATCDDCFKVKLGESRDDCRCCTYFPELGNFQLGLALASDSRDAVLPLVRDRFVLPLGLTPSPLRYQRTVATYAEDRFGEEAWMICPFVEPETFHCRIYPFRNSVCSTFFCTNDHGKIGSLFWDRAQDLVGQVESAVAQWCMNQVGLTHRAFVEQLDELAEDLPAISDPNSLAWSEEAYAALWGDWCGREVEFLEACGRLAMDHRHELFEISRSQAGREALVYEQRLRDSIDEKHRHAAPQVPTHNTEHRPVDSNWYKLQLIERQLWELPFQQGTVILSDAAEIMDNPRDDKWSAGCAEPYMVRVVGNSKQPAAKRPTRELFTTDEIELLRLFEQPQQFGEQLFNRPEVRRLDNARELLARCLRLGILGSC